MPERSAQIIIRDTTIYVYIPGKRIKELVTIETEKEINTAPSVLQTDFATSIAYISKSELHHELRQREQEISETIPEAIKETIVKETKVVEVNRLTWWQETWIRIGKVLAGVVSILIAWRLTKPKFL